MTGIDQLETYTYLDGDPPTTCPKCGARTEWEEHGNQQLHSCPRPRCQFKFLAEEDHET